MFGWHPLQDVIVSVLLKALPLTQWVRTRTPSRDTLGLEEQKFLFWESVDGFGGVL